jgi:hypothetical protein
MAKLISSRGSICNPGTELLCTPNTAVHSTAAVASDTWAVRNQPVAHMHTGTGSMLTTGASMPSSGPQISSICGSLGAAVSQNMGGGMRQTLHVGGPPPPPLREEMDVISTPISETSVLFSIRRSAVRRPSHGGSQTPADSIEGDWAGQVFHHDSTCAATASSCEDYVKYNPQAFADAYWTINSLRVYSENGLAQRVVSPRDNTPEFVSPLAVSTPGISTSPSLPFAPEAVVPETTPIDSVFNTSLPARHGHSHGDHGSLGGSKHSPKRKRNHRAARHLKHHMSRIYR